MFKLWQAIVYCSGVSLLGLQVHHYFNQPVYSLPPTYLEPDFRLDGEFHQLNVNPSRSDREIPLFQPRELNVPLSPNSHENGLIHDRFLPPSHTPNSTEQQTVESSIQTIAESITVKVLAGRVWGSGVLLRKNGNFYTAITNDHVLEAGNRQNYQIQTSDGQIYLATVSNAVDINGDDLGILQFYSSRNYQTPATRNTSLNLGESVFASGFPLEANSANSRGFVITKGHITLLMNRALLGGYQLGYTNNVYQGMSGGALLDSQGHLIGINGRSKYPLWGNPYIFKDGSFPTGVTRSQLRSSSWAIPIQTVIQLTGIAINSTNSTSTDFETPKLSLPSQPSFFDPYQPQ